MAAEAKEKPPAPSPILSFLHIALLLFLTWYICQPNRNPAYVMEQCGSNLHKIGVALEKKRLLSEDGLYPAELAAAFPEGQLPGCPVGGQESYLQGYQPDEERTGYLLVCKGPNHTDAAVPPDYPRIAFSVQEASPGQSREETDQSESQAAQAAPSETPAEAETEPEAVEQGSPTPEATPDSQ